MLSRIFPLVAQRLCCVDNAVFEFLAIQICAASCHHAFGSNTRCLQLCEDGLHSHIRIPKILAPSDTHKSPSQPLQYCLPCHIFFKFFDWMPAVSITFHRQARIAVG